MSREIQPIEKWTPELVESAARGETTIHRHGQQVPYKLNAAERKGFAHAKAVGYLARPAREKRFNLGNVWDKWCEATNTPYVLVEMRTKYASIHVDMIVTGEVVTAGASDELAVLVKRSGGRGQPGLRTESSVCFFIWDVPAASVDATAGALADIARRHRMSREEDYRLECQRREQREQYSAVQP